MNIVVNSQIFAHELRLMNKIAPTKAPVAILSYIRFTAEGKELQMFATDLEIGMQSSCPALVQLPGTVALPAARLMAMVEQFPNDDVSLAIAGQSVDIGCRAFKSRLQTLPVADFPQVPDMGGESFTLNAQQLRRLIASTRYAVAEKAGRYFLQGALLTLDGPLAAMVTSDGKRLAIATMAKTGGDAKAILPVKTLEMLGLQEDPGDVQLVIGDRHLFFVANGRTILSRRLDGQFPNYERIIPRDNPHQAVIDRHALAAALRRVGLVAEETESTTFAFSPGFLDLRAASANVGHAEEQVPITYTGPAISMNVSWRSVLDMLEVASQPTITLMLKDANTAILLLDGDHHLAVVMPMS